MLGVALSRVRDLNQLRVINWQPRVCCYNPPDCVKQFLAWTSSGGVAACQDLSCCASPAPPEAPPVLMFPICESPSDSDHEMPSLTGPCNLSQSSYIPAAADVLQSASPSDIETEEQMAMGLMMDFLWLHLPSVSDFIRAVVGQIASSIETKQKTSSQNADTQALYIFMTGPSYLSMCQKLFAVSEVTDEHFHLAQRIVFATRDLLLHDQISQKMPSADEMPLSAATKVKNLEDHDVAAAKVRYIGGSVIARLYFKLRKHLQSVVYEAPASVIESKQKELSLLHLLSGTDRALTQYPNSTREILYKQSGRLILLTDLAYEFFLLLEKERLRTETLIALQTHGRTMPGHVEEELTSSASVQEAFHLCFPASELCQHIFADDVADTCVPDIIHRLIDFASVMSELRRAIIHLYLKSGHQQFRSEVLNEMKTKKHQSHRKRVMERKKGRRTKKKRQRSTLAPGSEEGNDDSCSVCGKKYTNDQDWVQCDGCSSWTMKSCALIPDGITWDEICEGGAPWLCIECFERLGMSA